MVKVKIGYVPLGNRSSFVFPPPRRLRDSRQAPLDRRAVQACPAVNGFERRTIEALAPFDLGLGLTKNGEDFSLHTIPDWTRPDLDVVREFVTLMPRHTWRSERYPVVQITYPFFFVADEECFLTQMAAWASDRHARVPGVSVGGRFPAHLWPRALNFAFEWKHWDQPFRMKRGEPLFYLFAEVGMEADAIELVAGEMTEKLCSYREKMEDVVKFASGSEKLYSVAQSQRPTTLLSEVGLK